MIKANRLVCRAILLSGVLISGWAAAEPSSDPAPAAGPTDVNTLTNSEPTSAIPPSGHLDAPSGLPPFIYQPPDRGAPGNRLGGGTRSISQLSVLAPSYPAKTVQTQPRLYWYSNPGFRNKMRFRLAERGVTPPLLEIQLPAHPDGGVQSLDLSAHDVRLEPGKLYEWAVMLEPMPHQRLPPLISYGQIQLDPTQIAIATQPVNQRPYTAASQGYWYDALDWASQLLDKQPGNAPMRLRRADLLSQVGLLSAAMYERDMVRYRE